MTIHQMECFLEAAKTLNFTEAASRLYISQQGLSRQIASLEKELELTLHPDKGFLQQGYKGCACLTGPLGMCALQGAGSCFYGAGRIYQRR